jgi:hypothetical protein
MSIQSWTLGTERCRMNLTRRSRKIVRRIIRTTAMGCRSGGRLFTHGIMITMILTTFLVFLFTKDSCKSFRTLTMLKFIQYIGVEGGIERLFRIGRIARSDVTGTTICTSQIAIGMRLSDQIILTARTFVFTVVTNVINGTVANLFTRFTVELMSC